MKKTIIILFITVIFIIATLASNDSIPIKYVDGCEIDLDKNGESDLALIVESSHGQELIALMRSKGNYKAFLLYEKCNRMNLSCKYGTFLIETSAGKGEKKRKKVKTNGVYLLLSQPESAKIAFYWDENKFKKLWIAD
jgi:hypothetical protein